MISQWLWSGTLAAVLGSGSVQAHHGIAGVGAAGLKGPGATVESSTSSVLPQGSWLATLKLDHAEFKKFDPDPAAPEGDYSQFWMLGVGYGFTPWFTGYLFVPYNRKVDEPGGFTTSGWADISVLGQIGFKYDQGWSLVPANESLDDLEDWHFTVFGGATLPTGDPNLKDADGNVDPGKATGFGKPSWNVGLTGTKVFADRWTFNLEASHIGFQEYAYDGGLRAKFGAEDRLNGSLTYRLHVNEEARLRTDLILEAQYLKIGRDREDGDYLEATGGKMVYAVPGVRVYWDKASFALGYKKAVWTRLNESELQQGAEGKEEYRIIFSASYLL
jgi:hypothetical protein